MIVDTSALIAIALGEPAPLKRISVASVVEACLVLVRRLGESGRSELYALVRQLDIEAVPVDLEQGHIAQEAAARFGRGRHGAASNDGDCFSFALAVAYSDELLCIGDDFPRTDVRVVQVINEPR